MVVIGKPLTLDDFLKLPEEKPSLELFQGEVSQKVSPKGRHGALQDFLGSRINRFALPRKLARAFPELRSSFAGASPVPDVSVYLWDHIPRDVRGRVADDFYQPPDLVVEIVSPGQSVTALVRRCLWYVENGVPVALLVDPDDESVLLFRPNRAPRALRGADRIDVDDVLPGFELTVAELFASLQME